MCLIIVKPAGQHITRKKLFDGWAENPDGIGFMFVADKLVVKKGFISFRHFYKEFRGCERENPNSLFAVHFRFATHGNKSIEMTHPFVVNDVGIMHNGILSEYITSKNSPVSDTFLFCEKCVAALPKNWMANSAIVTLIENYAKKEHSKFVFMSKEYYYIANELAGEWLDGCWFSNKQYNFAYFGRYTNQQYGFTDDFESEKYETETDGNIILCCEVCQSDIYPAYEAKTVEGAILCKDCQNIFRQDEVAIWKSKNFVG